MDGYCKGKTNVIPWKFDQNGRRTSSHVSSLRWILWLANFSLCVAYTAYIDVMLVPTFTKDVRSAKYDQLGVHMLWCLMGTCFCYWAYAFFVAYSEMHVMLYNFVQASPGKSP